MQRRQLQRADELVQPAHLVGHGVAQCRVARGLAEAGQVGQDDAVVPRQRAGQAREVVLVAAEAVHQQQRLALAAFQVRHLNAAADRQPLQAQAGAAALQCEPEARHALRCRELQRHDERERRRRGQGQVGPVHHRLLKRHAAAA